MRKKWWLVALLSAFALVAASCGGDDDAAAPGDRDCTWVIGTLGALSGDFAQLGIGIFRGIELAIDTQGDFDLACDIELDSQDSQGSPDQAPPLVQTLIENERLVACVCPYFSGETLATGSLFSEAEIMFGATATNDTIPDQGFETWFRGVASDGVQGPTAAAYIEGALDGERVAVVHDNQDYSKGLADSVARELGDRVTDTYVINPEETDFSAVVSQVVNANPDVVYYGGYVPQAPQLLRQLREAGVEAQFVSDDGTKDPSFGEIAGRHAQGAVVTCPCVDPLEIGADEYVSQYREKYNEAPRTFSADMYDMSRFVMQALEGVDGDAPIEEVRQTVIEFFRNADNLQGVAKNYTWEDSGEFSADPLEDIWIYEWSDEDGDFVSLGPAADLI